jgi:hypothetical protein
MGNDEESQEDMLNKYITDTDVCNLEWRILNYICKMSEKYASFPETELLEKTDAKGYIDKKLQQDYVLGRPDSYYKLLMNRVMNSLIHRPAVEIVRHHGYGGLSDEGIDLVYYKESQKLDEDKEICKQIGSHGMMTCVELDRLVPKI